MNTDNFESRNIIGTQWNLFSDEKESGVNTALACNDTLDTSSLGVW